MLDIQDLHIIRSHHFGLRIKTLHAAPGSIIGVAGPNGCGKTTLMHCLAGLLQPSSGTVTIANVPLSNNLRATKSLLGFVPDDEEWLIPELCADEYFALLQKVYRQAGCTADMIGRTAKLCRQLYFTARRQPLGLLSHGNKKKVQLVAGLLHQPKLLLIDELRNGLDPLVSIAAEELLQQEAASGTCILAATHDLWWAERLADRTLILQDGMITIDGSTRQLVAAHGSLEALFMRLMGAGR
jgi:ABC-2 type transport system ATP-binding protein